MTETKLFVKNLPWSCDEDMLYNTFAEHGEVTFTRLCTDQESGRSRGFGFVSFSDEATADAAIKKFDNYSLDGRQITVAKAVRREDQAPRDGGGGGEKVCFSFQKGNCDFGDRCRFAHTGEGSVSATPRPQGACFAFQRGDCNRGDSCKFAHGEETPAAAAPAEPTNNKRKTFDEEEESESADEEETPAVEEKAASASEGSDSESEAAPEPEKKEKKEKKSKKAKVEGESAEDKEARKSAKKAKKAAKKAKK